MNPLIILFIVNFLRTVFIILIIYYGVRIITRYVLPVLLNRGLKNMQQKMQSQQRDQQRNVRRDGEVTIENRTNSRSSSQNRGEYVDFEEVE